MKSSLINSVKQATKYWWISLLIGVLAIALGILFIARPFNGLATLAILFAISFVASGILEITFSIANKQSLGDWGWILVGGILDLILGMILLCMPGMTIIVMCYCLGFWVMFRSISGIMSAFEMKKAGASDWGWLMTLAILGVLLAITFIISPVFSSGFIVALASISFIIYGTFRIYLAFKYKSLKNVIDKIEDKA